MVPLEVDILTQVFLPCCSLWGCKLGIMATLLHSSPPTGHNAGWVPQNDASDAHINNTKKVSVKSEAYKKILKWGNYPIVLWEAGVEFGIMAVECSNFKNFNYRLITSYKYELAGISTRSSLSLIIHSDITQDHQYKLNNLRKMVKLYTLITRCWPSRHPLLVQCSQHYLSITSFILCEADDSILTSLFLLIHSDESRPPLIHVCRWAQYKGPATNSLCSRLS